jgi:hypothetical protein
MKEFIAGHLLKESFITIRRNKVTVDGKTIEQTVLDILAILTK